MRLVGGHFLTDRVLHKHLYFIRNAVKDESDLENKYAFCQKMRDYTNREICFVQGKEDWIPFSSFVKRHNTVFCKPNYSCMGAGIFMAVINTDDDAKDCFDKMMSAGGKWIVEEKINQDLRMATWNASSVNTIRYYSFLDIDGNYNVVPHVLRTGRKGTVVDNGGSGGVFAVINPRTGVVYTDGIDETGKYYTEHPDSKQVFKGWQVPRWQELSGLVEKAHREKLPNHRYIGWDWALSENGWVLIEANWGQFLNQYVEKKGRKKEFVKYIGNNDRKRG